MSILDMIAPGVDFEKVQEQITGFISAAAQMKTGIDTIQNQLCILEDRIEYLSDQLENRGEIVARETSPPKQAEVLQLENQWEIIPNE